MDPASIDLIYIHSGTFTFYTRTKRDVTRLTKEERDNLISAEKHAVIFNQGDYIDQNMLDFDMVMDLHCIHCTSKTGKLIKLRAAVYNDLRKNDKLMSNQLHHNIFKCSPPMETRTEKATAQFLKLFKFHIFSRGKVL